MAGCKICDQQQALQLLRDGNPLIIPTDTVVGLGISVSHCASPQQLFRIKQRDLSKPIAWLVADPSDIQRFGKDVPQQAIDLAQAHWPGALTLVVKAADDVNSAFTSQDGTIALRCPDCDGARQLMRALGSPLATSSANVSGGVAATSIDQVDPRILEFAPYAVGGEGFDGVSPSGVASTVVDCTGDTVKVLRQGSISVSD